MPGNTALITGIAGQDGQYLAEFLLRKGYTVYGLVSDERLGPWVPPTVELSQVNLVTGNLADLPRLIRILEFVEPSEIYNLAARSSVAESWTMARATADATAIGVLNLLEAVRSALGSSGSEVRFFQASSSEIFGKAQEVPQRETTALWPRSPYGVAKAFGHHMTINYRESYGMHASSGILFNHESPRRSQKFVSRKISTAVARIALGLQDHVTLGNLQAQRDWGFAGDYVEAMWQMLQQDQPDDYIIATGRLSTLQDLIAFAFAAIGVDDWEPYVRQDPNLLRPADVALTVGDPAKAEQVLGWTARTNLQQLMRIMVEHDLELEAHHMATTADIDLERMGRG